MEGATMRVRFVAPLLAAVLAAGSAAFAQETTGTITGRIVDTQDLPIPGATVTVIGPQGQKVTTTNQDGRFSVPFLTPGTYTVKAELNGFKTVERKDLTVSLGQTLTLPIKLEAGVVSETVTITGELPTIDLSSSTTGAIIGGDFAARVPVGRRISDVTYM